MANALGTLFSEIATAIREKTGDTASMKPAEFPARISAMETGGGNSADFRYVTFMSHDGTVTYGKKAVAVGDDCADPIARGIFDTPMRESTAQYNYTFAGWATVANGGVDSSALKAVEEDRTVYANFISTVRYYTIRFYDTDGTTLLATKSVAYGSMPDYTPSKTGYGFEGWEPALTTVTGEASYSAQWATLITFSNASWEQIAEIAESRKAYEHFSIGDTKTVTLNFSGTTENITFRIVDFNKDDLSDGSGVAGITIMCASYLANGCVDVAEDTNYGTGYIWKTSKTRSVLNAVVFNALPEELRSVIKYVTKISNSGYSTNYGGMSKNVLYNTTDRIWLPSATELGLEYDPSYVAENQGRHYTYYTSNATRMVPPLNGKNYAYATRSMYTQNSNSIAACRGLDGVATTAILGTGNTLKAPGRIFGFCI